ncbi:MAG: hypothetical protein AB8I08_29240 [Sandaracinaceae bacterium]
MHPLAIAAGIGVSVAAIAARRRWNERRFWRRLGGAGRGRLEVSGPRARALIPPDGRRIQLQCYDDSLEISTEPDVAGLPSFRLYPSAHPLEPLHRRVPNLLGPHVVADTHAAKVVSQLVDEPARGRLEILMGHWSLTHWQRDTLRLSVRRWLLGSLRMEPIWEAIDALEAVASSGVRTLAPFGPLPGARLRRDGMSVGACELRAIVYRRELVVEFSLAVGATTATPFVIAWENGVRSGPPLPLPPGPFRTARLRFDGEQVHLAVVGLQADDIALPLAYVQRVGQALGHVSTPFR